MTLPEFNEQFRRLLVCYGHPMTPARTAQCGEFYAGIRPIPGFTDEVLLAAFAELREEEPAMPNWIRFKSACWRQARRRTVPCDAQATYRCWDCCDTGFEGFYDPRDGMYFVGACSCEAGREKRSTYKTKTEHLAAPAIGATKETRSHAE